MTKTLTANARSAAPARKQPAAIAWWLLGVAALVFGLLVVGGITRLTESGLSITEWNVVTGTLPPLSDTAWQAEFARYQTTTEFQTVNSAMTLAQFKTIYFWEYVHRLIARLIGLAFLLPMLWFMARGAVPRGYALRLIALFMLGGLQGAIGWWMVSSGLVGRTDVSHFRLAVHLLNALLIIGGLVWTALDLRMLARDSGARPARMPLAGIVVLAVLTVQLLFGAWTAGLNAGYVASSWPLMNDHFVPRGIDWSGGTLTALANDPFLVHFVHRWWAWVAAAMIGLMAHQAARAGHKLPARALGGLLVLQIALGIATVMSGIAIWLAVAHQAVAALLLAATVWTAHSLGSARAA